MDTMWRGGELTVREVQAELSSPVAYTTVMTTLDRLYKKDLVQRRRDGRAFLYCTAVERHELETRMSTGLLNGMLSSGPRRPGRSSPTSWTQWGTVTTRSTISNGSLKQARASEEEMTRKAGR